MTEETKTDKKIITAIFFSGIILFTAVLITCAFNSPKFMYSSKSADDFSDIENIVSSEISQSKFEEDSVFPLNINTATFEELQFIPDIGPATAKLIIDYRNEYGTIVSFSELLSINGIGKKTVERIKEYCVIN